MLDGDLLLQDKRRILLTENPSINVHLVANDLGHLGALTLKHNRQCEIKVLKVTFDHKHVLAIKCPSNACNFDRFLGKEVRNRGRLFLFQRSTCVGTTNKHIFGYGSLSWLVLIPFVQPNEFVAMSLEMHSKFMDKQLMRHVTGNKHATCLHAPSRQPLREPRSTANGSPQLFTLAYSSNVEVLGTCIQLALKRLDSSDLPSSLTNLDSCLTHWWIIFTPPCRTNPMPGSRRSFLEGFTASTLTCMWQLLSTAINLNAPILEHLVKCPSKDSDRLLRSPLSMAALNCASCFGKISNAPSFSKSGSKRNSSVARGKDHTDLEPTVHGRSKSEKTTGCESNKYSAQTPLSLMASTRGGLMSRKLCLLVSRQVAGATLPVIASHNSAASRHPASCNSVQAALCSSVLLKSPEMMAGPWKVQARAHARKNNLLNIPSPVWWVPFCWGP